MTTEMQIVKSGSPLALPDEGTFRRDIEAINRFQKIVHATLIPGQDYGVIPGTIKPTLLKPGAEKTAKLLGLSDQYEIVDRAENWDKPFFRYLIKCKMIHIASGELITEGLGECNSYESKYRYRWIGERDLPPGIDKTKLVSETRSSRKTGGHWIVYRFDNEDIFSQVNTLIKMAKKRALVDAALSAGRLSDIFTQDIEDLGDLAIEDADISKVKSDPAPANAKVQAPTIDENAPQKEKPIDNTIPPQETTPSQPAKASAVLTGEPQKIKDLLEWVASHGKEYTRSWVLKMISIDENELHEKVVDAYHELIALTGWDPR